MLNIADPAKVDRACIEIARCCNVSAENVDRGYATRLVKLREYYDRATRRGNMPQAHFVGKCIWNLWELIDRKYGERPDDEVIAMAHAAHFENLREID